MKKVFLILSMVLFTVGSFASSDTAKTKLIDNNVEVVSQEEVEDFDTCYYVVTYRYTQGNDVWDETYWYLVDCDTRATI